MGVWAQEKMANFMSHNISQNPGNRCSEIAVQVLYGIKEYIAVNTTGF